MSNPASAVTARPRPCVRALGRRAGGLLTGRAAGFTVLGGGSSALYLQHDRGEIIWLGGPNTPAHRRSAVLDFLPRVPRDAVLLADVGALRLNGCKVLDFRGAPSWEPQPFPAQLAATAARNVGALETALRGCRLLRSGSAGGGTRLPHDLTSATMAALGRVGAGAGLTPAGDDYAGGFLFALNALAVAGRSDAAAALGRAQRALPCLAAETHPISFTLLSDHSRGYGPEPLHDLAAELFGAALGAQTATLQALLAIGHSSGLELLAGFIAGASAVLRPEEE